MPRRKKATAPVEQTPEQATTPATATEPMPQPAADNASAEPKAESKEASPSVEEQQNDAPAATPQNQGFTAVAAPERGAKGAMTIDDRLGYRKELTEDGKFQLRFAPRPDGKRPDDEVLEPMRKCKPDIYWSADEKTWQARRNREGTEAINEADEELAKIGRAREGDNGRGR